MLFCTVAPIFKALTPSEESFRREFQNGLHDVSEAFKCGISHQITGFSHTVPIFPTKENKKNALNLHIRGGFFSLAVYY